MPEGETTNPIRFWITIRTDEEEIEDPRPLTPREAYDLYGCACDLCRRPWLP